MLVPTMPSTNHSFDARLHRLDAQIDFAVLAAAAGLLLVLVVPFALRRHGLLVGHLRRAQRHFHLAARLHALHRRVDLHVADARNDQLVRLVVARTTDRRIVVGHAVQARPSLSSSLWFFGVTANDTTGFGNDDRRHLRRLADRAQRVVEARRLQLRQRDDVARLRLGHRLLLLAVQEIHRAHALLLLLDRR
jgi:hypothetical protein